MNRYIRIFLILVALVQLVFAAAFVLKTSFATRLWPFPYTGDMSFIFIGSIFAAAAASTLWCIYAKADGALSGIALDYIAILVPVAVFCLQRAGSSGNDAITAFGISCVLGAVFGLALFGWSARVAIQDARPMPRLVRASFLVFVIALVIAGGQLVLKVPNILPWSTSIEAAVIYGWMFLGAAAYFAYGVLRPSWHNSAGQLAGFLAYDVVLIVPFLTRLSTIDPALLPNLIIYIVVVSYSGLLAIYYLFINRETRILGRGEVVPQVQGAV